MRDSYQLLDAEQLAQFRREMRIDPQVLRKLRNQLLKQFQADVSALQSVPSGHLITCHALQLHSRTDSAIDGATKLLFQTSSNLLIETVILRIASGRTALCLSSQAGCAAACAFCATGRMGIARNLTAVEILDQVLQAGQLMRVEGGNLQNLVFMGMGEPFHNSENVFNALSALIDCRQFDRPSRTITVSTVGVPDQMIQCVKLFPGVRLALSLHSAVSDVRASLIPLATRHTLEQLRDAVDEVNQIQDCPVLIEYLMLEGTNDSIDDAKALMEWTKSLNVHVNLIPFNPVAELPHLKGSSRQTIDVFASYLKASGLKTTVRYSLGRDIDAACGQLVQQENRRVATERRGDDLTQLSVSD